MSDIDIETEREAIGRNVVGILDESQAIDLLELWNWLKSIFLSGCYEPGYKDPSGGKVWKRKENHQPYARDDGTPRELWTWEELVDEVIDVVDDNNIVVDEHSIETAWLWVPIYHYLTDRIKEDWRIIFGETADWESIFDAET